MSLNISTSHYIVYKHTAPNDKVYIGITGFDPEYRWLNNGRGYKTQTTFFNAIIKYGWINFRHEVLFEGLTEEEALDKEEELIQQYKSYDRRYGYNVSLRGAKYGDNVNKEINRRERSLKHIPPVPKWTQTGRAVEKKDIQGNIVSAYKSVREAATDLKENVESLRTRLKKYKILQYPEFTISYAPEKPLPKIEMLSMNGESLRIFDTISDAYKYLNKTNKGHISQSCRGKRIDSYLGYKWRYYYENKNNEVTQ